mgnify:FL=1
METILLMIRLLKQQIIISHHLIKKIKQKHRRIQVFQFVDRSANDNNSSDDYQVEVPVKLSTEGSVGDRRQVSQATEIATTVPEAIVSIGPSIPVMLLKKR